ncbi:MAG: ribonuclease III [Microgenomates group bacterium]
MNKIKDLEKKLGIKFQNQKLLLEALTHRSYLNETKQKGLCSNERLEFLGDSILSFMISEWLFKKFPQYPEGTLTNLRSNLVKTESLAKIAKKFYLGNYLFLSKGEKEEGGQNNPTLLANALEAVLGAIFLDQGINAAKKFVQANFKNLLENLISKGEFKDFKSLLQEKTQAENKLSPVYKTLRETGPDHAKTFTVGVYLGKKLLATGQGKSKQSAEKQAAKYALEKLK